ncbi:hypothetical protein B5S33_g2222 [[Candida] boidinii]|nr:hypothetical protein B5S33_g2222 [[Candida] boidinii]
MTQTERSKYSVYIFVMPRISQSSYQKRQDEGGTSGERRSKGSLKGSEAAYPHLSLRGFFNISMRATSKHTVMLDCYSDIGIEGKSWKSRKQSTIPP